MSSSEEQIVEATGRDWRGEIEQFLRCCTWGDEVPTVPETHVGDWGTIAWARLALELLPPASVPSPPEPEDVRVVDSMGHEWGCPAYNAKTFTVCTCGRIHEPDFGLAPEQSSPGQAG